MRPPAHVWIHAEGVAVDTAWTSTLTRIGEALGVEPRYVPRHWVFVAPASRRTTLAVEVADALRAEGYAVVEGPAPLDPAPDPPPRAPTFEEDVLDALAEMRATGRR